MIRPCVLACLLTGVSLAPQVKATEWHVIRHQERDYVSFANVAEFYRFADYSHVNRTVSMRSDRRRIHAQAGTSELRINGIRFFTNYPIISQGDETLISAVDVGKIIEPILRPSRIRKAEKVETVVLDPGHGGMDQGAANRWGTEKQFALDVALSAREQLRRAGFKVELTRSADTLVGLDERVEFANRFSNAVFISIHFNTGGGNGVETYTLAPDGVPSNAASGGEHHAAANEAQPNLGNQQDGQNIALTAAVHAAVLSRLATFDRGVRHARFKVLRNIKIPAVLLEAGFLSDSAEGQRIATLQYRQQLGAAIAAGVQNYNAAVNYRSGESSFAVARASLPPHTRSITEPLHALSLAPPPRPQEPSVSISGGE